MPRTCTICSHENVSQINKAIARGGSFRSIALQNDTTHFSISRHARKCLGFDQAAARRGVLIEQQVDVQEEFAEQLAFAKTLRIAAQNALSDPEDQLQLILAPQAHEIEIMYSDFNDMEERENGPPVPKKKKAMLHQLLAEIAGVGIEANRVNIKQIDIRKFALDAITATDMCIDKFARMGGHYQKPKQNDATPEELAETFAERLIGQGWDRQLAVNVAREKFDLPKLINARAA